MRLFCCLVLVLPLLLAACSGIGRQGTIAQLRRQSIDIKEEKITGGLEKAMQSYERFLAETPSSAMAPEAIRRLADLKVEKEYGYVGDGVPAVKTTAALTAPEPAERKSLPLPQTQALPPVEQESEAGFEKRAASNLALPATPQPPADVIQGGDDLERAGPREAIVLYQKLLDQYPLYERNDQVLYQMSRAYEELGRIDEAMVVMDRLVREYPDSRYMDEVQFRRAEYFFTHRKFLDAEEAYKSIVDIGVSSSYYQLALYKMGWTFYKQELYEEAQHKFIALLDYKVSTGYDFEQTEDEIESKRIDDTFRVISLGFSYLGGAESVVEYFTSYGHRDYEDKLYENLGEYYYTKRRYADAVETYEAFISRNHFHRKSPLFHMRIVEINTAGGFPTLVIESKKLFAVNYGLKAEYWKYFEPSERPEVIAFLKTNLTDLAHHYHALYQNPKMAKEKTANFAEAQHWYRDFIASFPKEGETPAINYQLADLLLENRSFAAAAVEYEKTAYAYETHEQSSKAGYAAVYSYRQHLETASEEEKLVVKKEIVRTSLTFADTFPQHEKAAVVLGAAADDLYVMADYEQSLAVGRKLLDQFPAADIDVKRSAWLVVAHSSYELKSYADAEAGYVRVLDLLPKNDESRSGLFNNLAASIYKQGEEARTAEDYGTAARHFLRVGVMAPTSDIRATAEYDGAAALIQLKEWDRAATVLIAFRTNFPGHELQPEVTTKIAYVYREDGKLALAAGEYERIETESDDPEIRRDALQVAADLYMEAEDKVNALKVYRRYVDYFPKPLDVHVETRHKIAEILKEQPKRNEYLKELKEIVSLDANAGDQRTDRIRYLAARAALELAEVGYIQFTEVRLVKPFQTNLSRKQKLMKQSTREFSRLIDYEVGEVTAAATFYLAEIYAHFRKALMESERPVLGFDIHRVQPGDTLSAIARQYETSVERIARENNLNSSGIIAAGKNLKIPRGLNPVELEEYELAIEEQAYPFEEKAIQVHESNLELMALGIYNEWVDKSLKKLARFIPARYDKPEEESGVMTSLESFSYILAVPQPEVEKAAAETPAKEEKDSSETQPDRETDGAEPREDEASATAETAATVAGTQDPAGETGQPAVLPAATEQSED